MTFGRPPLIPNSHMECELPVDVPLESLPLRIELELPNSLASAVSGERLFLETS